MTSWYTLHWTECIFCEINIQNVTGYVVVTYRSPSQSSNEFEEFLGNFGKLLNQVNMLKSSFTYLEILMQDLDLGCQMT